MIAVCAFAALGGFLFLNTLYLQEVRDLSALDAGLYTLPIAAMTLVFAPLSGRLVGRRGPRIGLLVGGVGIALGGALLTGLSAHTSLASLLPAYFIFGIGFGMVNPPITNTAVLGMPAAQAGLRRRRLDLAPGRQTLGVAPAYFVFGIGFGTVNPPITNTAVLGMPPAQAGVAAAVASTSRQVGQTLGVAVVGAVAAAGVIGKVGPAFVQDSHAGWWIVTGCGLAVLLLGLLSTTEWANVSARRVAAELGGEASAEAPAAELVRA